MDTKNIQRICGGCTACCKSIAVIEIDKPLGKWCQYCSIGRGCLMYAEKPASCTEFRCEWLKGFGEEKHRPDRTKIILDYTKLVKGGLPGGILQVWEVSEGSLGNAHVKKTTLFALENEIWVAHFPLRGSRSIFVPRSQIVTEEIALVFVENNIAVTDWP
ncbi:MAG: hypothetical protein NTU85_03160 [Candidatus Kaiserbacteria bacterium]|nr:hypothetical protein [Candidatus Kaiserbacteria bacterium]